MNKSGVHTIAIVVPVYLGEETLSQLAIEIFPFTSINFTDDGIKYRIIELVLANDCGPDKSEEVIRLLALKYKFVKPVWLSRNFGQHAATLAGMAATSADWIVTMDEDGQHDPKSIAQLLNMAVTTHSQVVYAAPSEATAHNKLRDLTSLFAKKLAGFFAQSELPQMFSSFRLISGEIGRSLAAYAGPSVYLDVALSWIVKSVAVVRVNYRSERRSGSGYSTRKLLGHFWKLALTTGTRPLRYISVGGLVFALSGLMFASKIVVDRIVYGIDVAGWASVVVAVMTIGGFTLLALGVIAEYVGLIVRSTFGQPTYLAIRDPQKSPTYGVGSGLDNQ
jgi:undecaprenyl-phosphate 4-deoxy-4-formamido-L-arabinose transferase